MSLSIVLPAYEEAENLAVILPQINNALLSFHEPYEVLVIDTQKKMDNTEEVCIANHCMYVKRMGGDLYGDAIRTGIQCAKMDFLVIMDADGSHNPIDILKLYAAIQQSDCNVIIGSRYTKGGDTSNGIILKSMSFIVNLTYRIIFHIKARDVSNSFRLYRMEQIQSVTLTCDNFDIVEEILILLSIKFPQFSVMEIPIRFNNRMYGESKRDLWKFICSYLVTIHRMHKIRRSALRAKKTGCDSRD